MKSSLVIGTEIDDSGFNSWHIKGISALSKALEPIMLPIQRLRVPFRRTKPELITYSKAEVCHEWSSTPNSASPIRDDFAFQFSLFKTNLCIITLISINNERINIQIGCQNFGLFNIIPTSKKTMQQQGIILLEDNSLFHL